MKRSQETKLIQRDYNLQEAFGPEFPANQQVTGFEPSASPFVPRSEPHWVWDRTLLRDLIVWWQDGGHEGAYLFGHTGAGKSASIRQFCAALKIPMYEKTMYEGLEFEALVTNVDLAGGSSISSYAWLPLAMGAEGYPGIFVANEVDRADPGMLVGLHEILEGQPVLVHMGGLEPVDPAPTFRMAATGNTALAGDTTGLYVSAKQQDLAFQDRCWKLKVNYLEPAAERGLLARAVPMLPESLRKVMVDVANEIRAAFMGESSSSRALPLTMSTRTLLRWARMTWSFRGAEAKAMSPILYALDRALLNAADGTPEVRKALEEIVKGKLGDNPGGVG